MRILSVASQAFPLVEVGGLADVTTSLAIAIHELGHEPCLILPQYGSTKARAPDIQNPEVTVNSMGHHEKSALKMTGAKEDKRLTHLVYIGSD
jgi:glycogen synthase